MNQLVKKVVKVMLPDPLLKKSALAFNRYKYKKAMVSLAQSVTMPQFLPASDIDVLFKKYKFESTYLYDPESIKKRGTDRADEILKMINSLVGNQNDFLEIGCGDGMVSGILQHKGKNCTAIDYYDGGFDERARKEGVEFHKMDAADMKLESSRFDFIFSYNAFEHFPKPDKVVEESLRVLRPGGYLFMEFSPLFMSSYGLHAYKSIPIPYCQHLFRESDMDDFTRKMKLDPINFKTHVNRWTIEKFRKLWKDHEHEMETISIEELKNYNDLNLVWKYPSCFKSKTNNLDNLVVVGIKALFKKK